MDSSKATNVKIMKTFYVFGLILLVFACNPVNYDDEVLPSQQSDTGGDDEDPIIQGSDTGGDDEDPIIQGTLIFPNDSSGSSNMLISLMDSKADRMLDFTLTNLNGNFHFNLPRKEQFILQVICPDGKFRETEPFGLETLPAILKV
ncbi:hypothetical protein SAMN04488029_2688 [Reichenbachiella faecimaris]|uniref:Uncharacterized protein n=2 Tax=Reichenbachiella faecimaris TaxID=692418 RepID=A0A1W2GHC1_REIFA|nr:hypothetical protein SAMN04488029_2688 [Reichenbachiella faecimaris]